MPNRTIRFFRIEWYGTQDYTIKKGKDFHLSLLLPDLDSNQDILNQNQLYYPYTIRQSVPLLYNGLQK